MLTAGTSDLQDCCSNLIAAHFATPPPNQCSPATLVARWAMYSADGDMVGGDLPGWLPTLFRRNGSTSERGNMVRRSLPV